MYQFPSAPHTLSSHPPPHPTRNTRKTRIFPIYAHFTRITSTRKDSKKTRSFCSNTYGNDYQLNSPSILRPTPFKKLEKLDFFQFMQTIPELRKLETLEKKLEVDVVTHYEGDVNLIGKSYRLKLNFDTNLFLAERTANWKV